MTQPNTLHTLPVSTVEPPPFTGSEFIPFPPIDGSAFWKEIQKEMLLDFYNKVCDRAEQNMAHTGTVSGAHWNAMKQVLAEMGIEVTR